MIRNALRLFVFSGLSLQSANYLFGGLNYTFQAFVLITLALTLLMLFLKPVVSIIGLPSKGIGLVFMEITLVLVLLYVLSLMVPLFYISPASLTGIVLFGYKLPATNLTILWSAVFSAVLYVLVLNFFEWLCKR